MTAEGICEILNQARDLELELDQRYQQIQAIRSLTEKITTGYNVTGGGQGDGQAMEKNIIRLVAEQEKARGNVTALLQAIKNIRQLISRLDNNLERALLVSRYLNYRTWHEVADELHYSESQVYRLHAQALDDLARLCDDDQ